VLGDVRAEFGVVVDATAGQLLLTRANIKPATDIAGMRSAFITGVTTDARMILNGAGLLADNQHRAAEPLEVPLAQLVRQHQQFPFGGCGLEATPFKVYQALT